MPLAELAREAIVQYLTETEPDNDLGFFDLGESDVADGGRTVDRYVADAIVRHRQER